MYTKDSQWPQEINESRYNKVVLHVHQRQSVIIGDKWINKVVLGTIRSCYMYTKDSQWS